MILIIYILFLIELNHKRFQKEFLKIIQNILNFGLALY